MTGEEIEKKLTKGANGMTQAIDNWMELQREMSEEDRLEYASSYLISSNEPTPEWVKELRNDDNS